MCPNIYAYVKIHTHTCIYIHACAHSWGWSKVQGLSINIYGEKGFRKGVGSRKVKEKG